jgi:ankyrin repeat protein
MHPTPDEGILFDIQHNDLPALIQHIKDDAPQSLHKAVHSCGPPNCLDGSQLKTTSLSWLHVAAVYDALDCFLYLHGVEGLLLDMQSAASLLPIHYACYSGSLEIVTYIISVDPSQASIVLPESPHQLLALTAQSKNSKIMQLLLENGANPTEKLNIEDRPLDIAIENGAVECAEMLFKATCGTAAHGNGYTPAMLAIQRNNIQLAMLFLRSSPSQFVARNGAYPMSLAVSQVAHDIRWFEVIQEICNLQGRVDLDETSLAPGILHLACTYGVDIKVIQHLIHVGAKVNRMDSDGRTAASFLVDRGHSEEYVLNVLELFFRSGLDVANGNLLVADFVRAMNKPVRAIEWLIRKLGDQFKPKERPYLSSTGRVECGPRTSRKDQSKQLLEMFKEQMRRPSKQKAELVRIYETYIEPLIS